VGRRGDYLHESGKACGSFAVVGSKFGFTHAVHGCGSPWAPPALIEWVGYPYRWQNLASWGGRRS